MKPTADSKSTQRARVEGAALRLLSDERLARLAATGDRAAFAVIFDRYQQRLFGYCASILHDRDDAADAVQSTMLRAMRALEGEEREIAVRPWLYRIAHNESIELLRRPRAEPEDGAEVVTVSDVEADAAVRAHLRTVLQDIRELPDRQRSALVMRELSGLSYAEIGAALMSSEAGAKQAVYDARQALHELAKGRDSDCEAIRRKLSDGDRRVFRGRVIRAHLTACADCRTWQAELAARETSWAAFSPAMPAAAAAALQGTIGGGAGAAAAGSVASATATAPAAATMAVAMVLGAGAVGVNELRKGEDPERPPGRAQQAQVAPASAPASGRHASRKSGKPRTRPANARESKRSEAKRRAERARARDRAAKARDRRAARTGKGENDTQAGEGSTALGGRRSGGRPGGTTRGSGGNGIKSWVGGGRGRGGGGRQNGSGPIRGAVDETRDAVQGTVNGVQEALPVPTPPVQLPGAGQPRGAAPRGAH